MTVMGPLEVDLFASRLTRQLPRFYSWRPDSEAEAMDAFMQGLVSMRGVCQPPVVPNTSLSDQGQGTSSTVGHGANNTFIENTAMVSHSPGATY